MKFPKPEKIVDKDYLAWIERRPCMICHKERAGFKANSSDAHHINDKSGGSAKYNDHRTIPLCFDHHREIHQIGKDTFTKKYNLVDLEIYIEAYREIYKRSNLP